VTFGRLAVVILVVIGVVLPAFVVTADADAVPLAEQKARAKEEAQRIKEQLDLLDADLGRAVEDYNLARIKLGEAEGRVKKATRELKVARLELAQARAVLQERVIGLYKQRPVDIVDVFFQSSDFDELATQLKVVREIGEQDSDIVDEVERTESRVIEKRKRLVKDRKEAKRLVADVESRRQDIETRIADREGLLRGVEKEIKRIEREQREEAERRARAAAAAAAAAAAQSGIQNPRAPVANPGAGHPEVIEIAKRYLGVPYVYGAANPNVGFDCSGLVMYCYAQIGISLPHYSGYQQNMGKPVAMTALVPGDLVFRGYPVSYHVGMYAGGGQVIHAPYTGAVVSYQSVASWHYAVRL